MKKVYFETFGCRLNRAEALKLEAEYIAAGWESIDNPRRADVIVIRGCSVTAKAQRDSEKRVEHMRMTYPRKKVVVMGCMEKPDGGRPAVGSPFIPPESNVVPMKTSRAFLKVQDGCNSACTFCIVPQFRGSSISTGFEQVLDEAKRFIDAGYHEIVMTGCNLAQYVSDFKRLPDLMLALADLDKGVRIRLGSVEPCAIAKDVVEAMASRDNICRYLHMPIQSGSALILNHMARPYKIRTVNEIVTQARKLMPRIGLGCDLMTGFPGEEEVDFMATVGMLRRGRFSNAHVFPYSERPGTPAANMMAEIPVEIRKERAEVLSGIARKQRKFEAAKFIGHHVEFVVEDVEKGAGWTGERFWFRTDMRARGKAKFERRSLLRALVRRVEGSVLTGVID